MKVHPVVLEVHPGDMGLTLETLRLPRSCGGSQEAVDGGLQSLPFYTVEFLNRFFYVSACLPTACLEVYFYAGVSAACLVVSACKFACLTTYMLIYGVCLYVCLPAYTSLYLPASLLG
jgi:hypothetical protein